MAFTLDLVQISTGSFFIVPVLYSCCTCVALIIEIPITLSHFILKHQLAWIGVPMLCCYSDQMEYTLTGSESTGHAGVPN